MLQPNLNQIVQHVRQVLGSPDASVTDAQLLERFLSHRDEVAFELLVRRHERLVLGVCRRVLRNPHDADDAFQATFMLLVRKASSIGKRQALAAWLHQVAYRVALRANGEARKRAGRETTQVDLAGLPSREPDPAEPTLHDLGSLLDRELNRLPEKYRAAVTLCYLQGCTYEEAAQRLGVPRGTVSIWLTRARDLLRSRLKRHGGVVFPTALASVLEKDITAAPVATTVRAALDWAAGSATACARSARAAALAEGVLRTMFLTRIQFAAAALLAVALVTGGGLMAVQAWAAEGSPSTIVLPPGSAVTPNGAPPGIPEKNPGASNPEDLQRPGAPADGAASSSWQEVLKIEGHKGAVLSVAFSPDAKLLATGGTDGLVKVWDVASGKELHRLTGDGEPICSVAFSPDGKLLASAGLGKVKADKLRFWDPATGKLVSQAGAEDGPVNAAAFSADGKRLVVGSADRTVRLLALDGFKFEKLWSTDLGGPVAAVVVSPDGQRVCAAGGGTDPTDKRYLMGQLQVLEAATGKVVFARKDQAGAIIAATFSPDGKLVGGGGADRIVRLWSTTSGAVVRQLIGHTGAVASVAFSPDGKQVASGSTDHLVRVWDAVTGQALETITLDKPVAVVLFAPGGRFLVTASGGVVRIWTAKPGKVVGPKPPEGGETPAKDHLDTLLDDLLKLQRGDEQVLEALCLATLGRLPTDVEKTFCLKHVSNARDRRAAFADILHQLTSTKAFAAHAKALNERAQRRPPK